MNMFTNKPIACFIVGLAASSFMAAGVLAETSDVQMDLSATSLHVNQELVVTVTSKVYCMAQIGWKSLDGPESLFDKHEEVFNRPKQRIYKFAKAGKYRVSVSLAPNSCGNMANNIIYVDIVITPSVMLPPMVTVPNSKPATKPITKPCAKKGNQQLDPACIDN